MVVYKVFVRIDPADVISDPEIKVVTSFSSVSGKMARWEDAVGFGLAQQNNYCFIWQRRVRSNLVYTLNECTSVI